MHFWLVCLVMMLASPMSITFAADPARQAEVRERGGDVMPFSIADTLHVFDKTDDGGLQRVIARPGHAEQVPMIRAHLREIAEAFARRDFSGPERIHGADMPGLAELREAPAEALRIDYRDIDDGAEVTYHGRTPELIDALHRWFDAQLGDHGHDATTHAHHHGG